MQWYDYFGLFVLLYPGIMAAYWSTPHCCIS